ncbi:hypothetical protein MCP1_20126 [Candidatus Terasakiella magnetica]|nr:hypothetical protein MCP1_20126 [Candidatus Terasakiella magnetica]
MCAGADPTKLIFDFEFFALEIVDLRIVGIGAPDLGFDGGFQSGVLDFQGLNTVMKAHYGPPSWVSNPESLCPADQTCQQGNCPFATSWANVV